jgi:ectoine hydroxylase-related dioxygenase (phytanoyl-CoA dioxygenase family)
MTELALTVSDGERAAGCLRPEQHRWAALLLHTAGCVVLRDLLPLPLVDEVNAAFVRIFADCAESKQGDAWYQISRREQAVFWERAARWRIFPKLRPPFNDEALLANPLIMNILRELLGDDLKCKYVSSDTCLRGSSLQAPHREMSAGGATTPCAYIVNVPLTLCGLQNGPIEVWPNGSHLWQPAILDRYRLSDDVQDGANESMEEFARLFPSRKLALEPGSVLIRDPGMLHRGTPNPTEEPRTMLTICYLRRTHNHDYGDSRSNFDEALYEKFSPAVQRVFAEAPADVSPAEPLNDFTPSRKWWNWHRQLHARPVNR